MTGLPIGHTPEEVAASLQVNPERIRDLINAGRVGCIRASRRGIRLLDRHINELIAVLEVPAKAPAPPTSVFGATRRSAARHKTTA